MPTRSQRFAPLRLLRYPLALAIALSLGASCHHDHDEAIGPPTGAVCPTQETLTYANFGQGFMATYCLRCHSSSVSGSARQGAPSDHNFDSIGDIRSLADHIDQYAGAGPAAVNTAMPDNGLAPTEAERRKLSEWLACGAP